MRSTHLLPVNCPISPVATVAPVATVTTAHHPASPGDIGFFLYRVMMLQGIVASAQVSAQAVAQASTQIKFWSNLIHALTRWVGLLALACVVSPAIASIEPEGMIAPLTSPVTPSTDPIASFTPVAASNLSRPRSQQLGQIAQILPEPPTLPEPEIEPLPPLENLLPPETLPNTIAPDSGEIPETIAVRGYRILGSTVFTSAEFDAALAELTGEQITFTQLLQARTKVTEMYVNAGYITSGALLPPQTIEDGIVEIQVIEGALEDVVITGNRRLRSSYIRSRIERAAAAPLNVNHLLEALQLLQLNPLIESLSAELSAGIRPGLNLLDVEIREADSFSTTLRFDNGRSPTVGVLRGQLNVREGNLFGLGDAIDAAYSFTEGSDEFSAGYTLPLNASNATLSASARVTSSKIIEEPFDRIDIEADSRDFELTFRQPLIETPQEELAVGLSFSRRESDTSLLGIGFPLSNGANDDGETRISAFRIFQEWTQRGARSVFAARSQFNWGIPIFTSTLNNQKPDSRFFAWRGQAQYLQLLSDWDISLLLRADLQFSTTSLVALEQFGLGGNRSVRGYSQDLLLADNGFFGSAEVRFPLVRSRQGDTILDIHPFFDFGTVWNTDGADPDPSWLSSIGVGLSLNFNETLSAKIDWGIPLVEVDNRDRDIIERQELYFSIEWQPF